ncbi:hypothetical protein CANCADRAFT_44604 [Tortispora caseinolytica NRRL Y-17796]|uniref:BHLH domain-containing protein n=1 Tax=Tortispora caseinolytica NRRL Y-17796 TaxID=767744 RepID=A0A1E4TGX2_9ASCO|nr:hypothetical protein CANCADRAFT_44604 [Tortispora caseinolytica NRRL Y-17796]
MNRVQNVFLAENNHGDTISVVGKPESLKNKEANSASFKSNGSGSESDIPENTEQRRASIGEKHSQATGRKNNSVNLIEFSNPFPIRGTNLGNGSYAMKKEYKEEWNIEYELEQQNKENGFTMWGSPMEYQDTRISPFDNMSRTSVVSEVTSQLSSDSITPLNSPRSSQSNAAGGCLSMNNIYNIDSNSFSTAAAITSTSAVTENVSMRERSLSVDYTHIKNMQKQKTRRESHNAVERRRRDIINGKIEELGSLLSGNYRIVPDIKGVSKQKISSINSQRREGKLNKGTILCHAVEYLKDLTRTIEYQRVKMKLLEKENLELKNALDNRKR